MSLKCVSFTDRGTGDTDGQLIDNYLFNSTVLQTSGETTLIQPGPD